MKKRMLTMLLALVMIMSVFPFAAVAAEAECDHSAALFRLESKPADCIHEGAVNYFCKQCGDLVLRLAMPGGFGPHTYGKDSTCDVCGYVCKTHTYGAAVTVPATCTKSGRETKTCTECGHKILKTLKHEGHAFAIDVLGRVATCTVDGYSAHKVCSKCGERNEDYTVIPADGHDYVTTKDVAATCTVKGIFEEKCQTCGHEYKETRMATGHRYVLVAGQKPTCTEDGFSYYQKCTICGDKKNYTVLTAPGHNYLNGKCACGAVAPDYDGPSVPDAGCPHTAKSTYTTSPDCTNFGYKVVTCDACHVELSRVIVASRGHTEQTFVKDATCTQDGYESVYCEVCNAQISYTVLNHFGHTYANGICITCGSANPDQFTTDFQDLFLLG